MKFVRTLRSGLARSLDMIGLSVVALLIVAKDVMMSSWARGGCYEVDFHLGMPETVRWQPFVPMESIDCCLLRKWDGLGICLREDDIERLKTDDELLRFAKFHG